jgi:predicted neuraminidase
MITLTLLFLAAPPTPLYGAALVSPLERLHKHSSSIVETPNGDLLACWFHGHGEKSDNSLVILGARKPQGTDAWSDSFPLADNPGLPDQNCVLFVDPRGTLWLFWISSLDNTSYTYLLKYRTSNDYSGPGAPKWQWQDVIHCRPQNLAARFKESVEKVYREFGAEVVKNQRFRDRLDHGLRHCEGKLWQQLGWMTRTHPIMLSDTRMMLPLYSDHFNCSLAAFTEDWGKTWEFGEPLLPLNVQASFVQRRNGDIVAFMRDKSPLKRTPSAVSSDGGKTWSDAAPMEIPNPNSSVECIVLECGHWLLVCNDLDGSGPRGGRTRLTAFLSDDEGRTWKWRRVLEEHDGSTAASYPSVIQTRDGTIHCTYTFTPSPEETIKHAWFNEAWLQAEG